MFLFALAPATLAALLLSGCGDASEKEIDSEGNYPSSVRGMQTNFTEREFSILPNISHQDEDSVSVATSYGWAVIYNGWKGFAARNVDPDLFDKMQQGHGNQFKFVAFAMNGGWVMHKPPALWYRGMPTNAANKLHELFTGNREIKLAAFAPSGDHVILEGRNGWWHSGGIPAGLKTKMSEVYKAGDDFNFVAFSPGGQWILSYGNGALYGVISDKLKADINKIQDRIHSITFGPFEGYFITHGNGGWHSNLQKDCNDELDNLDKAGSVINAMTFAYKPLSVDAPVVTLDDSALV